MAIKDWVDVLSLVKYCNIWVDGCHAHLRNGDRFVYIAEDQVTKLDSHLMVRDV